MAKRNKQPRSNQELESDLAELRKKLVAFSLASLVLGSGGAFGVVTFFVSRPLAARKTEAETALAQAETRIKELEKRAGEATLDEKEQSLVIENFKARISLLESQLREAQDAGDKTASDQVLARLQQTRGQMEAQLEQLSRNLQQIRSNGERWFQSADGRRTVDQSVDLTRDLKSTVADIYRLDPHR